MTGPDGLWSLSLAEASELVGRREVTALELCNSVLSRSEQIAPLFNCFITIFGDDARAQAQRLDALRKRGVSLGPLHGIPVSIKDNIAVAGVPMTAGSKTLRGCRPKEDASVVHHLRAAGAVIFAKATLSEFAFGGSQSHFGFTRNPWNLQLSTSGSSGGSAAAVAAGLGYGSIGTDTGGSIRVPAAFCGVVGMKPTYEAVSRTGVVPVSASLDHVGPIARTAQDARVLFDAIAHSSEQAHRRPVRAAELTLGVPAPQASQRVDPEIARAVAQSVQVLADAGARLIELELPDLQDAQAALWVIASVEAADYHRERYRKHADDYQPIVRERLEHAQFIPAVDYVRAQRVRQKLVERVHASLAMVDAVLLPTSPIPAHQIGALSVTIEGELEDVAAAVTRYTPLFSLTGCPALSIPCSNTAEGLPIGLQIAARPHADWAILHIAELFEQVRPWQLPSLNSFAGMGTNDVRTNASEVLPST